FGGSWGAALALLYAQQHVQKVMGLIVRAVFLVRQKDLDWFAKDGACRIYPEQWQRLIDSIPDQENLLRGLCNAIWGEDEVAARRVTKEWMAWSAQVALGNAYQPAVQAEPVTEKMVKQVRMELHYARHHYFITENRILANCHKLHEISTRIIHGRQDLLCPLEAGMKLHQALPSAEYIVLPNAGHVAQGEEMIDALVASTDDFLAKLQASN
ncbi:MAG: alpha/beta fold hydrolase, partial [Methylococcaceae bacterium]